MALGHAVDIGAPGNIPMCHREAPEGQRGDLAFGALSMKSEIASLRSQ
jgi:hypothetical protein